MRLITFVKYSVRLTTAGRVSTEKIVPAVNISEEYSEFFPYLMHCSVHIAAGGAAAAITTVIFTLLLISRGDINTESIKGSITSLIMDT